MGKKPSDPTEPIRIKASQYPRVDKGTACTQSAFKAGNQAFLYCGPQGGRFKAMFKLDKSKAEAVKLAAKQPDRFDVGKTAWVTARFSAEKPMPKKLWSKWLDESYALAIAGKPAQQATKKTKKKATKKTTKKKTGKKTARKAKKKANKNSKKKSR